MANKEKVDFTRHQNLYTDDGGYGALVINSRGIEQYVWPIVRDLLGVHQCLLS